MTAVTVSATQGVVCFRTAATGRWHLPCAPCGVVCASGQRVVCEFGMDGGGGELFKASELN
jgi:hypothetical protein